MERCENHTAKRGRGLDRHVACLQSQKPRSHFTTTVYIVTRARAGILHRNSLQQYVFETSATDLKLSDLSRASFIAKMRLRQRLAGET
jgi:hypothetical protein